ncbi:MAG: hypothetical protein IJX05_03145 [Clostridia bacterium]|nr:hypothetical protein [Clostridia bacterium]
MTGRSSHQIDDKGRIRIPTKFKDILGANPFITVGKNNCLYIYPKATAETIFETKFGDVDGYGNDPKLEMMHKIFSQGDFVEEDKQGRIYLQSYHLKHLFGDGEPKKNVISIGMRDRVELWAEDVWNAYDSAISLDEIFAKMAKSE